MIRPPRPEHASTPFGTALLRPLEPNPGYEAYILDRFTVLVRISATCRYIRARVNAQIRDCNKTTDVRTTDSRTGIAPPFPLAPALLLRILPLALFLSLSLFFYMHLSRSSTISPTMLRSPFTSRQSRSSLLSFPLWPFLLLSRQENGTRPPLPLENWKLPGETSWSSTHALPVTFRMRSCGNLLSAISLISLSTQYGT